MSREVCGICWCPYDEDTGECACKVLSDCADSHQPVAWASEIIDALHAQYNTEMIQENGSGDALIRLDDAIAAVEEAEKFYTAPPQRKPLTEENIRALYDQHAAYQEEGPEVSGWWDFARAIERAHGIE